MKKANSGEGSGALMRDVAELAGVATSTVSRALANPGRVNEKTRKRISEAAEKLGYTPNAAARNLRVGKSNVVMIVLPGPLRYGASQVIPKVLDGINEALVARGFNLLISNLDRHETTERHILNLAFGGTVSGAIVLSSELPSRGDRSLEGLGIPVISLLQDLSAKSVPSVITNERAAMRDMTERLLAGGHRRFFYVAGPRDSYHEKERLGGILDALDAGGIEREAVTVSAGDRPYQQGFEIGLDAAEMLLGLDERPTAALCCSDDAAISFMSRIRQAGVGVPDALSVVGFDGAEVGAYCDPPLSTIEQPAGEMGRIAAELLLARLDANEVEMKTVVESHVLERKSSAPRAAG